MTRIRFCRSNFAIATASTMQTTHSRWTGYPSQTGPEEVVARKLPKFSIRFHSGGSATTAPVPMSSGSLSRSELCQPAPSLKTLATRESADVSVPFHLAQRLTSDGQVAIKRQAGIVGDRTPIYLHDRSPTDGARDGCGSFSLVARIASDHRTWDYLTQSMEHPL